MIANQHLTPDERRSLGIAVLTTALTTLAAALVTWGIDEVKRLVRPPEDLPTSLNLIVTPIDGAPGRLYRVLREPLWPIVDGPFASMSFVPVQGPRMADGRWSPREEPPK